MNKGHSTDATGIARRLANWAHEIAAQPVHPRSAERIADVLIDTLACAYAASHDKKGEGIVRVGRGWGVDGASTVIGAGFRAALPQAAFLNSALIRLLDFNDTYQGPRQIGHPSDLLGGAFAAAEAAGSTGADLQRAVRLGYEVYGRLLDLTDPESPWDHVTASGISAATTCGWLLRLPPARLGDAIALAASHSAALGEIRVGRVSSAKSIAAATVVQSAVLLTQLAGEGLTGPPSAIEGRRGYAALLLDGADFEAFFKPGDDRLAMVGLKPFPCFALGQGPVWLACQLRRGVDVESLERVEVFLADTGPARLRLSDAHGRTPESNEAADHSIFVLVALALLDGYVAHDQFASERWRAEDVVALIGKMDVRIDPALQPARALPCRVMLTASGRQHEEVCLAAPGSPGNPLPRAETIAKFRRCTDKRLDSAAQDDVVRMCEDIAALPSCRTLMHALV